MITKRRPILIVLTIAILLALCITACSTSAEVVGISATGDYKTEYIVGEELNTQGLQIILTKSDGTATTVDYAKIKADAKILGFNSLVPSAESVLTIMYKGNSTTIKIRIYSAEEYEQRYTITFNACGGSFDAEGQPETAYGSAKANGMVVAPDSPVRSGYAFDGWYKETSYTNQWNFNTDKVTTDITLFAKWSYLYKITFKAPLSGTADIVKLVKAGGELTDIPTVPEVAGKNGAWDKYSYTNIKQDIVVNAVYTDILYTVGFYDYDDDENEIELELFTELRYGTNLKTLFSDRIGLVETKLTNHPSRSNYHFVGWQDEFTDIKSDLKIYANYERDKHTVTYINFENDVITDTYGSEEVYHSGILQKPQNPIKEGYDFDGWYKESNYQTEWNFNSSRVESDRYLYAKWTKLWTLEFLDKEGGLYKSIKVRDGEDIIAPEVPEVTGYTGVWNRQLFTAIDSDDSISPEYTIKTFQIRFTNYDQTILYVGGQEYQTVTYNESATLPESMPEREGYTFKSWSLDYTHIISDADIVAQYEVNYYTVKFVTGDASIIITDKSTAYGSKVADLANESKKLVDKRHDFDGWFTESTFVNQWNGDTDVVTTNITLYAKRTSIWNLTFSYTINNETSAYTYTIRNGEIFTDVPDVPADEGKLGKWKLGDQDINFAVTPIYQDRAFTAVYTTATYYVTFHFDDGQNDQIFLVEYGKTTNRPTDPTNPTRTGYNFISWDKDPDTTIIKGTTVFYPIYEITNYTVTFAIKGETPEEDVIIKSSKVDYGSSAIAPDTKPTKDGYNFTGWDKEFKSITEDLTVYATFLIRTFTVSFRDDGNNVFEEIVNVKYNEKVQYSLENPSVVGYDFLGWDYDGDGIFDEESDSYFNNPIIGNKIIIAKFRRTTLTVTYNTMGGDMLVPTNVDYGNKVAMITPTRTDKTEQDTDYAFFGWYLDEQYQTIYDFNQKVTTDIQLYARWEELINGSSDVVYEYDTDSDSYRVKSIPSNSQTIRIANSYKDEYGEYKSVTSIGAGAMKDCKKLNYVYLPSTINAIGSNAFSGCTALARVSETDRVEQGLYIMPNAITTIGDSAFSGCTSLQGIYFSETASLLNSIGANAFAGCTSLTGFRFPVNVNPLTSVKTYITINSRAFSGCTSIKSQIFPDSVVNIGEEVYVGATSLRYVRFEHIAPPTIASSAFSGCSNSFRIYVNSDDEIPLSYTTDTTSGWQTYKNRILSSKYIWNNWAYTVATSGQNTGNVKLIHYIGESDSVSISEMTIKIGGEDRYIYEIGDYAFDYVPITISIHTGLTINKNTFTEAKGLKQISVKTTDSNIINSDVIYDAFTKLTSLNELSVSASKTLTAFFGGQTVPTSLEKVSLINDTKYTSIPVSMFEACSSIKEVTLPSQITEIGDYAFKGCSSLTTIKITGVRTIGKEAFSGCINLADMSGDSQSSDMPVTVTSIGENALLNTKYLQDKKQTGGGFVIVGNGILYQYTGNDALVRLPSTVRHINYGAFKNNSSVRTVIFGSDEKSAGIVSGIGDYAFANCISLENVIMPSTLSSIGNYAFLDARKFVKIIIINDNNTAVNVPTIGTLAFSGTMANKRIYLPSEETQAGYMASQDWVNTFGSGINSISMVLYDDWVYGYLSTSALTVVQYFGTNDEVEIPSRMNLTGTNELPVSKIEGYAFPRSTKGISLAATTILENDTFGGLTGLTSLSLVDTARITMQANNRTIFNNLLNANSSLNTLNVDGGMRISGIFGVTPAEDSSLTTVNVIAGNTQIVDNMFRDCLSIVNINLPDSIVISGVGAYAFENSGWLNNQTDDFVIINTANGWGLIIAYKGSSNIIDIPSDANIKGLNRCVFKGNTDVEIVYVYDNITNIYAEAFAGMTSLIKVFMYGTGNKVPYVAVDTFSGINSSAELFVTDIDKYNAIAGYNVFNKVENKTTKEGLFVYEALGATTAKLIQCLNETGTVVIPETINGLTITSIGNNVFMNSAKDITIFADDAISQYAFNNLKSVTKLTVLNTLGITSSNGTIINGLIGNNNKLQTLEYNGDITVKTLLGGNNPQETVTTIKISDGATELVNNMLAGASSVRNIVLPNTITKVGYNVFEDTAWYTYADDFVVLFNNLLYKYKGSAKTPNVPKEVVRINPYAFATYSGADGNGIPIWAGNKFMTALRFELGSQCKYIEENAFYSCTQLQKVDFPDTITEIKPSAFTGSSQIVYENNMLIVRGNSNGGVLVSYNGNATSVEIPFDVRIIVKGAFAGKTNLTTVSLEEGSNLTYICEDAFSGCTNLANFGITGDNSKTPAKISNIGKNAFKNTQWFANASKYLVIGERLVLYTGSGADAFTISDSVKEIASDAFASVEITNTVITFTSDKPIETDKLGEGALDKFDIIYVPQGSIDAYKGAWPQYVQKLVEI